MSEGFIEDDEDRVRTTFLFIGFFSLVNASATAFMGYYW